MKNNIINNKKPPTIFTRGERGMRREKRRMLVDRDGEDGEDGKGKGGVEKKEKKSLLLS